MRRRSGPAWACVVALLGLTMAGFMVGLPFYSAYYVVMRGFYSLEDTRVPALNAVLVNAISIAAGLTAYVVLPDRFVVPGLALAFSLGYVVGVAVLWRQLRVRLSGLNTGEVLAHDPARPRSGGHRRAARFRSVPLAGAAVADRRRAGPRPHLPTPFPTGLTAPEG